MACDWPADECLHDHIRPHLRDPRVAGPSSYRALAPCHNDTAPSLSVSILDGRVVWNCFTCRDRLGNEAAQKATRNALIRSGAPAPCLPQPKADAEAQLETIREIGTGKDSHAHKVLRIMALLGGWDDLPAGDALEALAESCGVSTREAYRARRASNPSITTTRGEDH